MFSTQHSEILYVLPNDGDVGQCAQAPSADVAGGGALQNRRLTRFVSYLPGRSPGDSQGPVGPQWVGWFVASSRTSSRVPGTFQVCTGVLAATQVTPVTVTLPAEANNQPQLQIRIITTNASGSDEWVGIDDINVSSSALAAVSPGILSIGDASIAEGNEGASDLIFTVSRTGGSDGAVSANWSVSLNGTARSISRLAFPWAPTRSSRKWA